MKPPAALLFAFVLLSPDVGRCEEASLDAIYAKFSHVASVRADFVEIKKLKAFKKEQKQKGTLFSSRDGSLVWQVNEPVRSTFTVKGDTAQVVYPDLTYEKTYDLKSDAGLGQVVKNIFAIVGASGCELLKKNYEWKVAGSWKQGWEVTLVPRSEAVRKVISKIVLSITEKNFVTAIRMFEAGGDIDAISFSNIVFNPPQPGQD